jgi:hypothetical protein
VPNKSQRTSRRRETANHRTPAFWTSLPGILTGLAGLLTAAVAVAGLFLPKSDGRAATHPPQRDAIAQAERTSRAISRDSNHRSLRAAVANRTPNPTGTRDPSPTSTPISSTTSTPAPKPTSTRTPPPTPTPGPDPKIGCAKGYVTRDAVAGDQVCVTPQTRQQAREDNAQASARRSSNGGEFGPDTCLEGYVWRETIPTDHVCVTPETRAQVREDNAQAPARRST